MTLRGDRFELLRPIASGGMATVHLARVLGAGGFERLVAIKVMHPHLAGEAEFVAMFLDEARLAAGIRHPNVVSTLDVHTDDQGVFLVMEYVEGPSLDKILRTMFNTQKRIPVEIIIKICLDALAGLHAAHELRDASGAPLNLVHRDVSPQNVLIGVDGIARLTDFGVARAESRLSQKTQTGQLKGKVSYMSPEQAVNGPLDRRTDIYAAGIVLWEALTNQRLVREANELLTLLKVKEADHKSPREFDALVPAAISDACMVALRKNPDDRYPTAAAFAEALENAAAEDGITIASARAVGAFVTACRAHVPASELLASSPASSPAANAARVARDVANLPVVNKPEAELSAAAMSEPSASAGFTPALGTSAPVTTAAPTPSEQPINATRPKSKVPVVAAVAIAAVVVLGIIVSVLNTDARDNREAAMTSEARVIPAQSAVASPVVEPIASVIEPAAPAVTSNIAKTATPRSVSTPAATTAPAPTATTKSPTKTDTSQPSKESPVYRPPEL